LSFLKACLNFVFPQEIEVKIKVIYKLSVTYDIIIHTNCVDDLEYFCSGNFHDFGLFSGWGISTAKNEHVLI